jgi:enoyl-CoA hydratase
MTELVLRADRGRVALLTLNRPGALNALNQELLSDLRRLLDAASTDTAIGCVVITGSSKAFAVGADIKEMQSRQFADMYLDDWFSGWDEVARSRKPIVAAVSGFALGGGCELAMMCDIIVAAESAKFGQPEIKLGVMPGIGGTQRLTRLVGRTVAMDLCLTGRMIDAREALQLGLVSRVVPDDQLLPEALAAAELISDASLPVAMMIKEAVKAAEETSLTEGIRLERRMFHSTFALSDQKEGMAAFVEKRPPVFKHL